MTLQDLGNIGEFVGAIGVVATLGYLTVQIRKNTLSVRASTFQEAVRDIAVLSVSSSTGTRCSFRAAPENVLIVQRLSPNGGSRGCLQMRSGPPAAKGNIPIVGRRFLCDPLFSP